MFIDVKNKFINVSHNKILGKGILLNMVKKNVTTVVRDVPKDNVLRTSNVVGGIYNGAIPIVHKDINKKPVKGGSVLPFDKKSLMPENSLLSAVRIPIIGGKKKIRNSLKMSI